MSESSFISLLVQGYCVAIVSLSLLDTEQDEVCKALQIKQETE